MDSREALEELQGKIRIVEARQSVHGTLLADMLQFELNGLEYAANLLKEVIEHDKSRSLKHLADMFAQDYYNRKDT